MPTAPSPNQSSGSNTNKNTSRSNSSRPGLPYLRVPDMTRELSKARIMDYQINDNSNNKFSDVVLKLYYNGGMVLWGLKYSSSHYATLHDIFGDEFDNWTEKEFLLGKEVRKFDQREFAHVEPVKEASGKKK